MIFNIPRLNPCRRLRRCKRSISARWAPISSASSTDLRQEIFMRAQISSILTIIVLCGKTGASNGALSTGFVGV